MLEPHILTIESSRRSTHAASTARREGLLRSREDDKEQRRREALRRVAPGFDGNATPLEPVRAAAAAAFEKQQSQAEPSMTGGQVLEGGRGRGPRSVDVMDELVDELERMTTATTTTTAR